MKKIIAVIVLTIIIGASCTRDSKENAAQSLIKGMLANTMFHPDSYEAVSFGTLTAFILRLKALLLIKN